MTYDKWTLHIYDQSPDYSIVSGNKKDANFLLMFRVRALRISLYVFIKIFKSFVGLEVIPYVTPYFKHFLHHIRKVSTGPRKGLK